MAELPDKNFGTLGCFDFWELRMEGGPWGRRFLTSVFIAVLFLSPQNQAAAYFMADDFSSLSRRLSIPSRIDPERAQAKKTVTIPGTQDQNKKQPLYQELLSQGPELPMTLKHTLGEKLVSDPLLRKFLPLF